MASRFYTPKTDTQKGKTAELGPQPYNRDNLFLAFGKHSKCGSDGQDLAGSGALVFEGEVLQLPSWQ